MSTGNRTKYLELPNEIHQHILSFIIHNEWKKLSVDERNGCIITIASFQSLNSKLSEDLKNDFNEFWWNVFQLEFGMVNPSLMQRVNELKQQMIRKNVLKRKVLLARFIKQRMSNSKVLQDPVKIVVFGGAKVGKSALTIQFIQGVFVELYDPTIEDSYRKAILLDGLSLIIEILDTAGQEEFSIMRELYMREADGFVVVCSLDRKDSIKDMHSITEAFVKVKGDSVPIVFVINKIDIAPVSVEISIEECKQSTIELIDKLHLKNTKILQASAKDKTSTDPIFEEVLRMNRAMTQEDLELLQNIMTQDSSILSKWKKEGKKCSVM